MNSRYVVVVFDAFKPTHLVLFLGRLFAVQRGMELDKKSPQSRTFLASLMDVMEQVMTNHNGLDN